MELSSNCRIRTAIQ